MTLQEIPPASGKWVVEAGHEGASAFTVKRNSGWSLAWLGEMNVIGRDNFVYGDGVLADKEGVSLIIEVSLQLLIEELPPRSKLKYK